MMLDPLTAVGLAASLFQFVEFGSKVLAESYQAYRSTSGVSQETSHLIAVTDDVKKWTAEFDKQTTFSSNLSQDEKALVGLRVHCHEVACDLLELLESFRVKHMGHLRAFSTFKQSIRLAHKGNKINKLTRDLDNIRSQINTRLLAIFT